MQRKFIEFDGALLNINHVIAIYTEENAEGFKNDKPKKFGIFMQFIDGETSHEEFASLEARQARQKELYDLLVIKLTSEGDE